MDTLKAIYARRAMKHYDPEHEMTPAEVDRLSGGRLRLGICLFFVFLFFTFVAFAANIQAVLRYVKIATFVIICYCNEASGS